MIVTSMRLIIVVLAHALFGTCLAGAAEIVVRPPALISEAIKRAAEGDTIIVQPGVYTEHLRIEKRLAVRGQIGAVVAGSLQLQAQWDSAEASDLPGVFVAHLKKRPHGLLVNGKFVAELRLDKAATRGEWHWRSLLAAGPPLSEFKEIRALWLYHPDEQRLYVRFGDSTSPARRGLSFVPTDEPLLTIERASGVTVDGLTFANASKAVVITDGATDCVLRRCKVTSYERAGIVISDGATRCVVEECEITRGAYEEWQPSLEHNRANYEIWRVHKEVGNSDRVGIQLYHAGAGNRILRNRIDRTFDGICVADYKTESLDKPLTDPDHNRGTEIAGNVIENTRDSGIELGTGCVEVNVHHNVLRRTHGGLRFKVPRIGPVFVHHNRLIDGAPFNIWFSMDGAPAEGYVYHNTIIGGDTPLLVYSSFNAKRDAATPRWHFMNNLAVGKEGFFDGYRDTPPPDFIAAHNISTGTHMPWPDDKGRDKGSRYELEIKLDENGRPLAGSAAVDAGMDLSTYWNGKLLPGCEPGTHKGKAPDAGADEVE